MNFIKPLILTCLLISASTFSFAQNKWWNLPNIGFDQDTNYRIEDIYFLDTSVGFAVSLPNRIYRTADGGTHWNIVNDTTLNSTFRSVEFLDDKATGIAGGLSNTGELLITTDTGKTWTDIGNRLTDTTTNGAKRICGIAHYSNTFYCIGAWSSTTAKLYKSTDKGATWTTKYFDTNVVTSLIDGHFVSQDTGFITGQKRARTYPYSTAVILKTTDGGNSWSTVFADTTFGGYIWKIQFVTDKYVVAALENLHFNDSANMVRSLDGGNTWQIIPVGNTKQYWTTNQVYHYTQACGFVTPAKGWVGGYYEGVFETVDSGKTWNYLQFGADFNRIFRVDTNHVFAGGLKPYKYGTGPNLNIPFSKSVSKPPHQLFPVYPNPTNGNVNIEFYLGNETNVVLEVISLDSKRVYPIANTHLSKGKHRFSWNGSNAPAGNYMIWMGNNEVPMTRKFVLLK